MKGSVRAKGKCPQCHSPFTDVSRGISMHKNLGIICLSCKRTPNRFYIDLHHLGKRVRIFSDKQGNPLDRYQKAVMILNDIHREVQQNRFDGSAYCAGGRKRFLVHPLLDTFSALKQESLAPSCRGHYRRYGQIVQDFFGKRDVREITEPDLSGFREHLLGQFTFSEKTQKNIFDFLKAFLRYCKYQLAVLDSIPPFPEMKVSGHRHTWLSREDQRVLLEYVPDDHRPIIVFLMLHGCRPSEARALKCRDIDLQTESVSISAVFSGSEYRVNPLEREGRQAVFSIHPEMFDYMAERVKNNLPDSPVFVNPRTGGHYSSSALDRAWFYARRQAGLGKGVRLYDVTRHSFASQLVSGGVSLFAISKLLRHSGGNLKAKYDRRQLESLRIVMKSLQS